MGEASVGKHLAAWIISYLFGRPQYVRVNGCVSDVVACSTGAPLRNSTSFRYLGVHINNEHTIAIYKVG